MRIGAKSDIGRYRKLNEDNYFIYRNERLLGGMVADGMGGYNSGEIASKMATELVKCGIMDGFDPEMDYIEFSELLRRAFLEANEEIFRKSKCEEHDGMGTTAVAAFVYNNKLITANIGDSRVYSIEGEKIRQITKDHSYVEELLDNGTITPENAKNHPQRNYITRALGTDRFVKSDISISDYSGEIIVICSDGLTNLVSDEQIMRIVLENDDFDEAEDALIELANKKGGTDNITCVIFEKQKG